MLPLIATAVIASAAIAGAARAAAAARRLEADTALRLATGPDGVIPGAHGIDLDAPRGAQAALLLHGFGDTPQTLAALAADLHARGWAVRAPLLPGHGRSLAAFAAARADQWIACARDEWAAFSARHPGASLVGLSMGGAIASVIAAESPAPPPPALVLIAPYVSMPTTVRRIARMHRAVGTLLPWVTGGGERSIHDPDAKARSLAYGACTPRLLWELAEVVRRARAALPRLAMPVLVIQSRHDNRIPVDAAERAFALVGAPEKRLEWRDVGGHVITVDEGREAVFALVADWIDRHAPAAGSARAASVANGAA